MESFRTIVREIVDLENRINVIAYPTSKLSQLRAELDDKYELLEHIWRIIPGKDTDHEPSISELEGH